MEKGQVLDKPEIKKDIDLNSPTYFVIENLPSITTLRKMSKNKTTKLIAVEGEKWELSVTDTEDINSPKRMENMKEIMLTKIAEENGNKKRLGIFTEEDFGLALGLITGNASLRFNQPVSLAKLMKELKSEQSTK